MAIINYLYSSTDTNRQTDKIQLTNTTNTFLRPNVCEKFTSFCQVLKKMHAKENIGSL